MSVPWSDWGSSTKKVCLPAVQVVRYLLEVSRVTDAVWFGVAVLIMNYKHGARGIIRSDRDCD